MYAAQRAAPRDCIRNGPDRPFPAANRAPATSLDALNPATHTAPIRTLTGSCGGPARGRSVCGRRNQRAAARGSRGHGLEVELQALISERDQNFRLRCDDGRQFVLKIANAAEELQATDFQIQALLYLEAYLAVNDCPIVVPRILRTEDDSTHLVIPAAGERHLARIVSYVAGVPLGDAPPSALLCRRMGNYLAHLGQALRGFDHPGARHELLWDMQQALELRRILEHIPDAELRHGVAGTLDDFELHALGQFASLRAQVIHSDLNPDNLLVDCRDHDLVAGVIDFGDMVEAPLIVDVAIGASYLGALAGNPLVNVADFLLGYHSITPLELAEIDLLYDLIKTRLAASITILSWRASLRGADDPYLAGVVAAEGDGAAFLRILLQMPRDSARRIFRQVCASV